MKQTQQVDLNTRNENIRYTHLHTTYWVIMAGSIGVTLKCMTPTRTNNTPARISM